mmetsp:Transcript_11166/g.25601  ORF Transcript_11166/g.25601 Transcript_11166/m.25601 type:complete len:467 (+) Transcript_11166:55-1455(+)
MEQGPAAVMAVATPLASSQPGGFPKPLYVRQSSTEMVEPPEAEATYDEVESDDDALEAEAGSLAPFRCGLGAAGRLATAKNPKAAGVWRGRLQGVRSCDTAAKLVLEMLEQMVELDRCGLLANTTVELDTLEFRKVQSEYQDSADRAAAEVLEAEAVRYRLCGDFGQVLSHNADLWVRRPNAEGVEVLLKLSPSDYSLGSRCLVSRRGPMGPTSEEWSEVPVVELPQLLRLTMSNGQSDEPATERFLVADEEELLVVHCWMRQSRKAHDDDDDEFDLPQQLSGLSIDLDQLCWYDTQAALSEMEPCAETPVPMQRVVIADEGLATQSELLQDAAPNSSEGEDVARHASLSFMRQFVPTEVLEKELLPRLLPEGSGSVRVMSAQLRPVERRVMSKQPSAPLRPKSLDALFTDDLDFRKVVPWKASDANGHDEDSLAQYELTSVCLLNETAGFMACLHCLQQMDPVAR